MRIRLFYVPLLILFIAFLHFAALYAGIYDRQIEAGFVWWDNVLHAFVGATFGLGWLWLLQKYHYDLRSWSAIISTIAFVLLMAIAWEVAEYFARIYVRGLAESLKLYSPNLGEAISDVFSNLIGAALLSLIWLKIKSGAVIPEMEIRLDKNS